MTLLCDATRLLLAQAKASHVSGERVTRGDCLLDRHTWPCISCLHVGMEGKSHETFELSALHEHGDVL